jgi:hypothetical protein
MRAFHGSSLKDQAEYTGFYLSMTIQYLDGENPGIITFYCALCVFFTLVNTAVKRFPCHSLNELAGFGKD